MAMDIISTYKYLLCFCKKKIWELNKFLNIKIVIYKIIISFRLIGLIFFVLMQLIAMVAVEVTGRPQISFCLGCELSLVWFCVFFYLIFQIEMHNFCLAYHVALPWWWKILQLFPSFIHSFGLNWFLDLKNMYTSCLES